MDGGPARSGLAREYVDEALDLIESAAATGIIPPSALQEDLWFEALREEPRFVAAVETCRRNREAR